MKKIKDLWNNNRVMFVLATIVIICLVIICCVMINMFVGIHTSSYGDRLDNISDVPLKEEDKVSIENKLKENDVVSNVNIHTQGKIIYIRISFQNVSLERAKEIAGTTIENIKEEYQKLYDIHFTLTQTATETSPGFTIMGAKNINRTTIIWNNNTPIETEE